MKENAIKKVTINMGSNVLEQVDNYAMNLGVNRSAAITFLCNHYFTGLKAMEAMETTGSIVQFAKENKNNGEN